MKLERTLIIKCLLVIFVFVLSLHANSQACKDAYNNTLNYYNKGNYEYISDYLSGCLKEFKDNSNQNIDLVFKVYKLIVYSYRNIDKDNLANQKFEELVTYFKDRLTRDEVQKRFDDTALNFFK